MTDSRFRKTGRAALDEIDARLTDLFGELGSALVDMIHRLDAGSDGELWREQMFETEKGPVRAQAGIRLRVGGLDAGQRRDKRVNESTAGREAVHPAPPGKAAVRPVAAEIVDDSIVWRLTADLPGAARENLELSVEDATLVIAAEARGRRYAERVSLPPGTSLSSLVVRLQNGILEIEAPSRGGIAP